jgi:PIN domain nuclease of toxin-antitoxin system
MTLLLDTHVWLWAVEAPEKLGRRTRALLLNSGNDRFVSAISALEIARLCLDERLIFSAQRRGSKIRPEICTFSTWTSATQSHSKRTRYPTRFTAIRLIGFWWPRRGRTKQPY